MSAVRRHLRRLASDRGFTMVELMVAAVIAAVGVGALTTVLTGSRDLTSDAERRDAQAEIAEREMERTLAIPYAGLALAQAPSTSSDPLDPRYNVAASGPGWTYKWDGSSPAAVIVDTTNGQVAASTNWSDGRLRGTIYRFVTVYDDPNVANDASNPLPDGKRVTVAVTVTGGTRPRKPVVLTSVVFP